jgi:hypothetical protein
LVAFSRWSYVLLGRSAYGIDRSAAFHKAGRPGSRGNRIRAKNGDYVYNSVCVELERRACNHRFFLGLHMRRGCNAFPARATPATTAQSDLPITARLSDPSIDIRGGMPPPGNFQMRDS